MSKIVQAVNSMITNSHLITNVMDTDSEIFFLYKKKYKWSMSHRDGAHFLWFYPGDETLDTIYYMCADGWQDMPTLVTYKDTDIGTKEAQASFSELYTILKEKLHGMDDVLDDIISDAAPF